MVQHIEIDGEEYPFQFSMRTVYKYSMKMGVEFHQANDKIAEQGYDDLLELFAEASKQGAKKEESDKEFDKDSLEEQIDDDPYLFIKLQQAFQESKAFKAISGAVDGEATKKK